MTLHAYTDGASRGNPGSSGIGVVVKTPGGETLYSASGYIGLSTNNRAEYVALLTLLEQVRDVQCDRLCIHSDSELMVRQMNGQYKVKDAEIRKYHRKAAQLLSEIRCDVEIRHIPRERNAEADRLANEAIDRKTVLMPEPFPLRTTRADGGGRDVDRQKV
jgi:ribonuclease HI